MSVEGLTAEQVEEARRQFIKWVGPDGGPTPTVGAVSDLLAASRQWLEWQQSEQVKWCFRHMARMDNLSYCERRNVLDPDPEDRCEQEPALVIRGGSVTASNQETT